MITTRSCSQHPHPPEFCRRLALAFSAVTALLMSAALVSPVAAEQPGVVPRYDRRVLSDIARDVLSRGANGPMQSVPAQTLPGAEPEVTVTEAPPGAPLPATSIEPPRETIAVRVPAGATEAPEIVPDTLAAGYHSNSWRQRPRDGARARLRLGRSPSGVRPRPRAEGPRRRSSRAGSQFVYGFRPPPRPGRQGARAEAGGPRRRTAGAARRSPQGPPARRLAPRHRGAARGRVDRGERARAEAERRADHASRLRGQGRSRRRRHADPDRHQPLRGRRGRHFRRELEAAGVAIGEYDAELMFYRGVASGPVIDRITALDFVLFVELIGLGPTAHDQSTVARRRRHDPPGADLVRAHPIRGAPISLGIMDTGVTTRHLDLARKRLLHHERHERRHGPFVDNNGHGTHVLGTIVGTGAADSRFRAWRRGWRRQRGNQGRQGLRPQQHGLRPGSRPAWTSWSRAARKRHALLVNLSGGFKGYALTGTDSMSSKLDQKVWNNRQLYVVAAGNEGSDDPDDSDPRRRQERPHRRQRARHGGLRTPSGTSASSSRGPTGDGRMKPNLVAPGQTSPPPTGRARTNSYIAKKGTSMAAAHVTGLAATLMEHYPYFQFNPALMRAHLMATAHGARRRDGERATTTASDASPGTSLTGTIPTTTAGPRPGTGAA